MRKIDISLELQQEILNKSQEGLSLRKIVAAMKPFDESITIRVVQRIIATNDCDKTSRQSIATNHRDSSSRQNIATATKQSQQSIATNDIATSQQSLSQSLQLSLQSLQQNIATTDCDKSSLQTSQQHDIATTDRTTTDDNPSLQALQQIIATKDCNSLSQQQINELIRHAKNLIALIEESQKIIDVLEPTQSQIDYFNDVTWSPEVEKKKQYYIQIRKEFSDQKQKQEALINTLKQQFSLYEAKTVSQDEKEIEVIPEAKQEKQVEENKETVKEEVKVEATHSTENDEKRKRLIQQLENEIKDIKTEMFNNDIEEQPLSEERMKKLENWSNQGIPPIESERLNYNLQKKRKRLEQLKSDKKHKPKYTWADIKNPNLTDEERAKMLNEISSEDEEALFEEWFSESPYGSFTAIGA